MDLFGVYPGGEAGSDSGMATGAPDNSRDIERCLTELQGKNRSFVVRAYERFDDLGGRSPRPIETPRCYGRYLGQGRLLDLVVMFQSASADVAGFLDFARQAVAKNVDHLYSVQVTEEASFTDGPDVIDGPYPKVRQALVEGALAVKEQLRRLGRPDVKVGFNSTPTFGPKAEFWSDLLAIGGSKWTEAIDYVGLDFFPDVFRPAAPKGQPGDLRDSTIAVLEAMRNEWMPAAGLGSEVALDVAEHGWPTGPTRPFERQAEALETVIRTVWEERLRLNIARYTLFSLRDAGGSAPNHENDIFFHFGITQEDYSRKPAYHTFQRLVAELGQ